MDKDTLVLKNGAVVELEAGARLDSMEVVSESRMGMAAVWGEMTEDNLSEVQIRNGAGLTAGRYTDLVLVSETSVVQGDGTILTSFRLREKTDIEKRIDALEEGQEVQDGAIIDVAQILGDMAGA